MGQQAIAKRNFVDDRLDKLFTAAVQRSIEVKGNVLALAQWLVNSVTMENLLPIYGNLRYDDIYGRSVLAMSLSTDETLTFESMCEKLQQQADRLSTDRGSRAPSPGNNSSYQVDGNAKMITVGGGGSGGSVGGSAGNGGGKSYIPYKPKTYWNGQNSKPTYQKHQAENDDIQSQNSDRSNDKKKSVKFDEKKSYLNKKNGKGKGGGGKAPAHGKSAKVHRNDDDEEETGFIFKVFGVDEESTEPDQLGVSLSTSGYIDETEEVSLLK